MRAINAEGTRYIAEQCRKLGCKLMYISTDYVFDGQGSTPWQPDCTSYAPLNVYGQTKLEGELAVRECVEKFFIVRIAWVFGVSGNNFIKTMIRLGQTHDALRVVCDQIGTPTYTLDLARLLVDMIETEKYGCYHATNEGGYISWADFAREIFKQAAMPVQVIPVTTKEYGLSKAARPYNSRLCKDKLMENGFIPLPDWKDALQPVISKFAARLKKIRRACMTGFKRQSGRCALRMGKWIPGICTQRHHKKRIKRDLQPILNKERSSCLKLASKPPILLFLIRMETACLCPVFWEKGDFVFLFQG